MEKLWGKRFLALLIDAVAVTLVIWILSALIYPVIAIAGLYGALNYWLVLAAIIIVVYFTYLEANYGVTLGKNIMKIKVIADEGKMTYNKALIRSLSKILWFPLIIDVLVGYVAAKSKIRYLDKVAGTDVISLIEDKNIAKSIEPKGVKKLILFF
ncbi:MAG: RDD family protein [Methanobacterium sp.]